MDEVKRVCEIDYGTMGGAEAKVGWNYSVQQMSARCNVVSSWI